ncbi:DsbA family protein [Periweissella fabalis]|uniref:Uncharacterized protein n=1 Tax=Periweissella fabalis TaxID=1070421 RepID=A0A7X6N1U0_9LACO|nr:DsbA family protein [Periweissella fabalis]MCM0598507.1 DsbA family protein [Periweissella fabalis]NKZ24211.1 hypothetical protein [Periweissella fabalis]
MLEVFHFITPLQFESFQSQKALTQVLNTLDTKYSYHILPLITLATTDAAYHQNIDSETHILSQIDYALSLDFVAILSQGRYLARKFLQAMQEQVLVRQNTYSDLMVEQVLNDLGADLSMFAEERQNNEISKLLIKNQQFANYYNISKNPSAIIFDSNNDENGIIIENFVTTNLDDLFNQYLSTQQTTLPSHLILHR